jgi:prolyl-tRNA synthetase
MQQSKLFTKTRREAPSDEVSKNAQLLIRAGYVHKEMAGVYAYLPLGLKVLNNIVKIIREEMNKIGGQEMVLPALQDRTLWEKTDRWSDEKVDNWFKTEFKSGGETGLGITHEEPMTQIMSEYISSYRDLPTYPYQFQNKFRNEMRAKSGIMRGKEFMMKDLYSFSRDEAEHLKFYAKARDAYAAIFKRVDLGDKTFITYASGGIFSEFSEEFQTLSDAGEDTIYIHENKKIAINKEVLTEETLKTLGVDREDLTEHKAIETGNIFNLGTKFSEPLGLKYKDEEGNDQYAIMGCYGLGPTRLMGTLVEVFADAKGIVWPKEIAPFSVHLVELSNNNTDVSSDAAELYRELTTAGIEVLWDDRDARAGEKFADSDLLGIPLRVVVSEKTLAAGKYECVERGSGKVEHKSLSELLSELAA